MDDDPLLGDHKLCGFLRVVLSAAATATATSLAPRTPCSLFGDRYNAGFLAEDGTLLVPISKDDGHPHKETTTVTTTTPPPTTPAPRRRGRKKKIGTVYASVSVVQQIQTLVSQRCLVVRGTVVGVSRSCGDGSVAAVVLVDMYFPMAVWSGWQFPKSGSLAASLFRHVSCDWELRRSLLYSKKERLGEDDRSTWYNSDCHVLGCNMHCSISNSCKSKLFDLHEIFKSLPTTTKEEMSHPSKIEPENSTDSSGIWNVSNDVLTNILATLGPRDLASVSSTCHHLRFLASSTVPHMKLKLFPHQQAALEWMLKRERNTSVLSHPLYMKFSTEDGFHYFINAISGKISTGQIPTVNDFRGGMFCDEPGLGKTITALSLIFKTLGTLADPPHGVDVVWCTHNQVQRCGYYELSHENISNGNLVLSWKRSACQNVRRGLNFSTHMPFQLDSFLNSMSPPLKRTFDSIDIQVESYDKKEKLSYTCSNTFPETNCQHNGSLSQEKKSLLDAFEKKSNHFNRVRKKSNARQQTLDCHKDDHIFQISCNTGSIDSGETWVQCDACRKWRRLSDRNLPDTTSAWFCSMNSDLLHQSCSMPEESWDRKRWITYLPGFYAKETTPGKEQNVSYFISILKEHLALIDSETKKALGWLADLSFEKLSEMETNGLTLPVVGIGDIPGRVAHGYEKIFQAFGLVRKVTRGRIRWHYPRNLENLAFDSIALRVALTKPLDSLRLYLSRATLIIVPANLIEHWKTQIQKLIIPGQLRVFVWIDHKRPSVHNLAWDYDIVITTFSRLSAEWSPHKKSVLMQVHWLRVMLDEGHTLGSSLTLTNKLQMAISLTASSRWILTGTPTPNTPSSQLSHLQPMLKFLHEETYGLDQECWDAGILKPFELQMEEGRFRLLQLLGRTMISARKKDLKTIPPCIKKATFLHFNEEHARSYNELVVTVRRNILMADWNDPSHVESLLNPKQWKFRANTIRNVRLSCCVAGHIKVAEAGHDICDTMDIFVQQGLHPLSEEYEYIRSSLINGGCCMRCKDWCRLPLITPCRHLLCLDCVALDSERCTLPGCGNSYEMQYPEMLTRPENPNPKWPVPKDLIELQPSYRQDNWDPDWQSTSSSKVSYLVERLKHLQEANRKLGCFEDAMDCKDISYFAKSYIDCFSKSACENQLASSSMRLPYKVIIFSQFLEHIHVIEQQLTLAGIDYVGMYSPMHSSNKMKSLMIFQKDTNCLSLLMDGSAALGLDLSFVTHVFLMEPIWDRSMEEQVISRAHRMGATRPIHVETLAMHGTIEEQMLEFLQDTVECRKALKNDLCRTDVGTRIQRTLHDFAESNYLSRLGFVRTKSGGT